MICPRSRRVKVQLGNGNGGAEGDRTPDLVIANDALSQLSYGPAPNPCRGGPRPSRSEALSGAFRPMQQLSHGSPQPGETAGTNFARHSLNPQERPAGAFFKDHITEEN